MRAAQIVLIEDNPADVLLIEMALKESNIRYEMTRFEAGEDAVDALCEPGGKAHELHPDAILLDLNTPRSDGFDVLGKLRRNPHLSGVPIAIITSSQARSDKHRTSLIRAVRYIEKPSQLEAFLRTVGEAVREMLHV
jgi:two-component system, chemotaxis family, response regulator Rcp1